MTLRNDAGLKAARSLSDAIADMSVGSIVSRNGIPTIRNAALASLAAMEAKSSTRPASASVDAILDPAERDYG